MLERTARWEAELSALGVAPGSVVLLEGELGADTVALLLALLRRGDVAVPLTPAAAVQRDAFAAIAEVGHLLRIDASGRWQHEAIARAPANPLMRKLLAAGRPGLVLFSSGSTGTPKAVLHDFAALLHKLQRPGQRKSTLTLLLFDHIGGVDVLLRTLANGGTLVTPERREPDAVCAALAAHRVHTLPASPTFLNLLLLSGAVDRHDLSSLAVIAYGTEPMPAALLERLRAALPAVKLVQTYGTSELGVLRTKGRDGAPQWVRLQGDGFETRVVDGVLWVRSPAAMLGYLNAPDLFDADGWLNTEDAVEVDGEWLRVLGRVTDLINVGGQKVYPAEVENVVLQLDNVRDVSVRGEPNALLGHIVTALVSLRAPEPLDAFKQRLRAFCKGRLPAYKIPARVELSDAEHFGARMKKLRRPLPDGAR